MFLAVGLYFVGLVMTRWYPPLWLLFFAAWIFVIVSVVAEAGRSMEQRKAARAGWASRRSARSRARGGRTGKRGARSRIRTADPLLTMEVLCRLS